MATSHTKESETPTSMRSLEIGKENGVYMSSWAKEWGKAPWGFRGEESNLQNDKSRCSAIRLLPCHIDRSHKIISYGQDPYCKFFKGEGQVFWACRVSVAFSSKQSKVAHLGEACLHPFSSWEMTTIFHFLFSLVWVFFMFSFWNKGGENQIFLCNSNRIFLF